MSERNVIDFESRFERRVQRYADIPVRAFDAGEIARGAVVRRVSWRPALNLHLGPKYILVLLGLLLAMIAASVAGSVLLREVPAPDTRLGPVTPQPVPLSTPSASPVLSPTPTPTSDPNALHLIVFGDSMVTYAAEGEPTYPQMYADLIEAATDRPVETQTFGHSSWHTDSALVSLGILEPGYPSDVLGDADIVLVTIGANNGDPYRTFPPGVCRTQVSDPEVAEECVSWYASGFAADIDRLLGQISRFPGPKAVRITSPDFNRFIGWDEAPSPTFGEDIYVNVAFALQVVTCQVAERHEVPCTGIVRWINGITGVEDPAQYLEADRENLNLAGRRRIAEAVFDSGLYEINPAIPCIPLSAQSCF